MTRGFEYAGARTVLLPLWNVEGQSTIQFAEAFYRIADSEPDKALAFQKAVGEIRVQFPLPYYWAGFVMRGQTGRHDTNPRLSMAENI